MNLVIATIEASTTCTAAEREAASSVERPSGADTEELRFPFLTKLVFEAAEKE